jgi:hypothetical protein
MDLCVIDERGNSQHAGAARAAEHLAIRFHTVANDPAPTVVANGRQLVNRALEAIKDVTLSCSDDLE